MLERIINKKKLNPNSFGIQFPITLLFKASLFFIFSSFLSFSYFKIPSRNLEVVCSLDITNVTVGTCSFISGVSETTVDVEVTWIDAPIGENIEITIGSDTQIINVIGGATSPSTVQFTAASDSSSGNTIAAQFSGGGCADLDGDTYDAPISCASPSCVGIDPMIGKVYDIWHTGSGGGLDFGQMQTTGAQAGYPSTFIQTGTISNMPKREGGATFCNPSTGEMLIYSDGEKGWDKAGNEYVTVDVLNKFNTASTNLSSAAGTPLIVASPGQCNSVDEVYIFYTDDHSGATPELYYAIVDVPNKTISLPTQLSVGATSEQINAVQVSCDTIWIVYRNGVDLNAIRWTPSGFEAPVVTAGIHTTSDQRYRAAFSLDGTRFAATVGGALGSLSNNILVADFDQQTGQFSNNFYLDPRSVATTPSNLQWNYGIAFSPDGTKLYATISEVSSFIDYLMQFDLSLGTVANVQGSITKLGEKVQGIGGIQNAPDGRLYLSNGDGSNNGLNTIHVVDFPNLVGVACNFQSDFLNTGGLTGSGLNNIVYGLGSSSCIPVIDASIGVVNACSEMVINTHTNSCYLGVGGPYDVFYTFEGVEDTLFNQTPIGDSIVISGLITGLFTDVHVTDANGCLSNHLDLTLAGLSCPEICDNGIDDDLDGLSDCEDSDCSSSCPTDACLSRVTDGLIALYNFKESAGDTVFDVSSKGTVAPLIIQNPGNITRLPNYGISINSATTISSTNPANKIIDSLSFSNALSLEAWIKPANVTQNGPARIITISQNQLERNITIGQRADQYVVRLRTSVTNTNGNPEDSTAIGTVNINSEQHLVLTWDGATGEELIYLDGVKVYSGIRNGYLNNWDDTYQIAIGNELIDSRPWLGEIYSVAVYNRALDSLEVVQNVTAGYCCPEICNNGIDDDGDGDIDLADTECACSATSQVPIWVVDEETGVNNLRLWSYSDYTDTNTGVDYGRLSYFDPSTSTIKDAGDGGDMESMAINTYTGVAYFMTASRSNNGPSSSQALFQYDLNEAANNQGNIILTLIGHITQPNAKPMEALAFDAMNNRFYLSDPVDFNNSGSIVPAELYYIDFTALNADPLLATMPTLVGTMSGSGETCNYVDGLEFGDNGNLYAIDGTDGHLYEINPTTGAILAIIDNNLAGGTGNGSVDIETICWDAGTQKMIAIDNSNEEFIELDLTSNGNNTVLMNFLNTVGMPSNADLEGSAMFDVCQPKMAIGNLIFKDNNNNSTFDSGEGLDGVVVELYQSGVNVSTATPLDITTTGGGGFYIFENLIEGGYFIHIPASEFAIGAVLEYSISANGSGGDNQTDNDDNGIDAVDPTLSGVSSDVINLTEDLEPINGTSETGEGNTNDDIDDNNGDMTVDFAFIASPEICNDDIDNDGDGNPDCFDPDCPCYAPFTCDAKALYQTLRLSTTIIGEGNAGDYVLYQIDPTTATFSYLTNLNNAGLTTSINTLAYNPIDNFLYAIKYNASPYVLYRINAAGELQNIGTVSGLSGVNEAGCMDDSGNYYIAGSSQNLYIVDINTQVATLVGNLGVTVSDMAINPLDGFIYGWSLGNRQLVRINPSDASVTYIGSPDTQFYYFGAVYFNTQGELIAYGNDVTLTATDQESLVKINTVTGVVSVLGIGPNTANNDGCSCAFGVELTKSAPDTSCVGNTISFTFTISNNTGVALTDVNFADTLTEGLTFTSDPYNISSGLSITGSTSGLTQASLILTNVPIDSTSFEVDVNIPIGYSGGSTYTNKAYLNNLSASVASLPDTISSDNPNTIAIGDATDLVINSSPTVSVSSNSPICVGDDLSLGESGGDALSWSWSGPNSFSSTAQNPTISGVTSLASGNYTVTITGANTCTTTSNINVLVNNCVASLGDFVWQDDNEDGIQNFGESGIEGVTVLLYDNTNTLINTTTTIADGSYLFNLVSLGTYYLVFDVSTSVIGNTTFKGTLQNIGSPLSDSNPNPVTGRTASFLFTPTLGDMLTLDAGYILSCPHSNRGQTTILRH